MRKKKHAQHENHERWLVSYADFITLLFAFFVVMFASSQADKGRAKEVSEAVQKALEGKLPSLAAILGGAPDDKGRGNAEMRGPGGRKTPPEEQKIRDQQVKAVELQASLKLLSVELENEIKQGKVQVSMEPRGLVVSLRQAAFFPSGEDTIAPDTYPTLEKLAGAIRELPNPIRLEGHTDSRPINTARFPSNWELSAARSVAMLHLFADRYRIPPERMAIVGYADTAAIQSNDTDEGRAKNRRVDIVILNTPALKAEPAPVAAAVNTRKGTK
ncbi:MAG TPA: flagellar motor protein MotB [Bryobacteraceae bacterium]|nr:flagellar motor protein MotB [Bryobacteraceae bacterium]